jgi:hypothetical protein
VLWFILKFNFEINWKFQSYPDFQKIWGKRVPRLEIDSILGQKIAKNSGKHAQI